MNQLDRLVIRILRVQAIWDMVLYQDHKVMLKWSHMWQSTTFHLDTCAGIDHQELDLNLHDIDHKWNSRNVLSHSKQYNMLVCHFASQWAVFHYHQEQDHQIRSSDQILEVDPLSFFLIGRIQYQPTHHHQVGCYVPIFFVELSLHAIFSFSDLRLLLYAQRVASWLVQHVATMLVSLR